MLSIVKGLAAACMAASLAFAVPAAAQDSAAFSAQQKEAIGDIVRDYLLTNPEILEEVFAELERRQSAAQKASQQTALRESHDKLFASPHDVVLGNPKGDVTLVEFFDYNCGFCKRALEDLQTMMKDDPNLRVVLKDFPVLGPGSVEAARISLAAKEQLGAEGAAEFHTRLMKSRGQIDGARAAAVAKEMGLDVEALQKEAEGSTVNAAIAQNVQLGDDLGIRGTPAWVLGDSVISGAVGAGPLAKAVANVRRCGKTDC